MTILGNCSRSLGRVLRTIGESIRFTTNTFNSLPDTSAATSVVRKGTLLELREMEYPKFFGSALHNVRLPSKPLYLFKIECADSLNRETLVVLSELTAQNRDAVAGMPVTVTSRRKSNSIEPVEHTVTLD